MSDQVGGARILAAIKNATALVEKAPNSKVVNNVLEDLVETVGRSAHMTCGQPGSWRDCPSCSKALDVPEDWT